MSAIITGMDIPESCRNCKIKKYTYNCQYDTYICPLTEETFRYSLPDDRTDDCPLKSIDGLIEKLMEFRDESHCVHLMDRPDIVTECIEIIKEYCEVKE